MKSKLPRIFLLLLGGFFLINLLQSYFTPLIFDEAYYWHYAKNLAWGYFDHPPLVAVLVKLSGLFFDGELGVRFMTCLVSTGTLFVLWSIIDIPEKKDNVIYFFVLTFSMTLFNAYGFFTLPDTPLLFFTALFLYVYKRFLTNESLLWAVLLGLTMAGLMYSKYHAALVILFVLLSNLKLVTNKYAWLAVITSLICYTPHFIWLYQNDFVTINYHLYDRPNSPYNFNKYTLGYLLNLVAIFGLTFPWIYWSLFKTRSSDKFTKALLYLTYGVILFFLVSSFHRRIQAQWAIIICIPLIIIVYRYMMQNDKVKRWIYITGSINILIILYLRVGLIHEPLSPVFYETHGNKKWVEDIHSRVGDTPLVFENSYRNAPMYSFYSGGVPTYSFNTDIYRRNQYSIDNSESKVQHKEVLYVSGRYKNEDLNLIKEDGSQYYGRLIDDFESFRKLQTLVDGPVSFDLKKEQLFKIYNPYDEDIDLEKLIFNVAYMSEFKVLQDRRLIQPKPIDSTISALPANDTITFRFKFPETKAKDAKYFRIGIAENGLHFGINGKNTKLE